MDPATAAVVLPFAALAVGVAVWLTARGAEAVDDRFTPADRRLLRAAAVVLGAPAVLVVTQVVQAALLSGLGPGVGTYRSFVWWGVVEGADGTAVPLAATCAALGIALPALAALGLVATVQRRPANAARNFLRLELARLLVVLTFGVQPVLSVLNRAGDLWALQASLSSLRPGLGDLALLLFGMVASLGFFVWRRSARLRARADPLYDQLRSARARVGMAPEDPEALRELGAVQLALGDRTARDTLRRARRAAPDDPRTAFLLGRAHLARGEAREATAGLRAAGLLLEADAGADRALLFEVTLALAAARLALGDRAGAVETAAAASDQDPRDLRGVLVHADALVAAGRRAEARRRLERAAHRADGPAARELRRRLRRL